MQKREKLSRKVLGLFCALVLLVTALYVPVAFNVSAADSMPVTADETTVFTFDDSMTTSTLAENKTEFEENGIGIMGWGVMVENAADDTANKVFVSARSAQQTWATTGGCRLNKLVDGKYQVYNLEANTTYVVSMKTRVISSSQFTDEAKTEYECYVSMGYGAKFTTNDANYVSTLDKMFTKIVSTKAGSGVYTLTTQEGEVNLPCGNEWQQVVYQFTTPADLGEFDHALGIYGSARTGFRAEIDDLSVTKLGENTGAVVLKDEYSGKCDVQFGTVGAELSLPDVSDRAQQDDHTFEGWYANSERTEKIEKVTYTKEKQVVYTAWKAPVTITFNNTLDDTASVISGIAGESFSYPADPTDPAGKSWFMGWYTTAAYTEEHTSGKFGYASIELYSYWKSEVPGLVQDFEVDYPYGKKEVVSATTNGITYKRYKDYLAFANTMTLQGDVTPSEDSKVAVKFVWDSAMYRDTSKADSPNLDNPAAYNAATRYAEFDNYIWLGKGIENNQAYTISFKVKVEKAETDLEFYAMSASASNGWGSFQRYQSGYKSYAVSDEWQTVSFQFTTNFKSETATTMYLGVRMMENKDVVLYFDDIEIKAVAQPYESLIVINNGYNNEVINLIGTRGETITFPTLTHPNAAPFKGWYLDEACTEEVDFTTYPRSSVTVYAKWGSAPIKFNETYVWDTDGTAFFKPTLSIEESTGVGYDDNYALKFRFKGTDVYNESTGVLMNTRWSQRDHVAAIAKGIKDGALYRVSYYYKASDASNCAVTVNIGSGYGSNVWVNGCWNSYDSYKQVIPVGDTGWNKVEFFFCPQVKTSGNMVGNNLFMLFGVENNNPDNYAELYIDNVLVEDVSEDYGYIYFDGNDTNATDALLIDEIGEKIQFPTLVNGKFKVIGWYLDPECTVPFTATTIPAGGTTVYAEWYIPETYPMTFEYGHPFNPQPGNNYGKLFSYAEGVAVGVDDDYALRWRLKGTETYVDGNGNKVKWATRSSQEDHVVPIAKGLQTGEVYHVTYYYKVEKKTNTITTISLVSAHPDNIWVTNSRNVYSSAGVTVKAGGTDGWQKADFYISANVKTAPGTTVPGSTLYLQIKLGGTAEENYSEVLLDNISVEKISAPYVFFEFNNGEDVAMVQGKAGEEIVPPANPTRFGHSFKGWYKDIECTEKFDLKVFEADTEVTAYAGWTPNSTVTYSFEKYDLVNGGSVFAYADCEVKGGTVKSGKQALHFGNRTTGNYNVGGSYAAIAQGKEIFTMERGYQYIVTVNYNAKKVGSGNMNLAFIASNSNFWSGSNNKIEVAPNLTVVATAAQQDEGKWMNKTFVLDTSVIDEKITDAAKRDLYTYLYLRVTGAQEWDVWFDDITITKVPKGSVAVCIDNSGYSQIPTYLIGREGQSYSSKLPDVKVDGKYFKGYYTKDEQGAYTELKREDMVFKKEAITIYARFLDYEIKEDFEGDYAEKSEQWPQYTTYDFDYEIYDAAKEGNSKDNVTNGNYSLHRKGDSMYFENAVILTLGNQIAEGERYTVSFKVKMGEYKQTDGAIKVVSGRSFRYAWTTTGDYYPVIAISDLTDGQWHEVSYTFNSVEAFACIQTPGYVELFMDEFKFTIAGDEATLSTPVSFTEYVPAKRDAEGNLVEKDKSAIDVTSIIDISLYTESNVWLWVIIAVAAVLVIGGGVLAFVLIKKKKQGKA